MAAELLELARRFVTADELPKELTHMTCGGSASVQPAIYASRRSTEAPPKSNLRGRT